MDRADVIIHSVLNNHSTDDEQHKLKPVIHTSQVVLESPVSPRAISKQCEHLYFIRPISVELLQP